MEQNEREVIYYHAFNCVGGFGPQKYKFLLTNFPSLEAAWNASREALIGTGISQKLADFFLAKREKLEPEKLFAQLNKENIIPLVIDDKNYPPQLKEIHSAPPIIYIKGNIEILKSKSIAVVGSRKFTDYGRRVAQNLCRDLVSSGLAIVSGLALGIDAISHRAAIDANGITIAVLGSGLDDPNIFPRENFNLSKQILESGGALISEYPPRTPSFKQNFPARNRLMAGLTLGTLVVEAALGSGSLITADYALEFGREIFSVPGPLFSPQSEGTNELIKKGAKLVGSAKDILEELRIPSKSEGKNNLIIYEPKSEEEKIVWKFLGSDPLHVDRLVILSKLNPALVASTLAMMEIGGAVRDIGGKNYIKA
jgi:DNA processing protein